jgi:dolichol-phosphate mannosyltransferase
MPRPELSVVVPVYKEEGNIPEYLRRMIPILDATNLPWELIFSMDPSPDGTEAVIRTARERDPRIKLLKFSRRFGQPAATLAGLTYAQGDAVVVMDVDLQDPPEVVTEMIAQWRGGFDVVYGQRRSRTGENFIKLFTAWLGYAVISRISDVKIPRNAGDFRLISRRVVNELVRLKESHGFLRGLVSFIGFRQTSVQFDRPARHAGQGNYLTGFSRIALNGLLCFSYRPLQALWVIGLVLLALCGATTLNALISSLFGYPWPLWPTLLTLITLFLGGLQMFGLGLLGEYLSRVYDEVRDRPKFILDEALGFDGLLTTEKNAK